jgi:hypothetical protein
MLVNEIISMKNINSPNVVAYTASYFSEDTNNLHVRREVEGGRREEGGGRREEGRGRKGEGRRKEEGGGEVSMKNINSPNVVAYTASYFSEDTNNLHVRREGGRREEAGREEGGGRREEGRGRREEGRGRREEGGGRREEVRLTYGRSRNG